MSNFHPIAESMLERLSKAGYEASNVLSFGVEEPEELDAWMREHSIYARWIDIRFEFGETVFEEGHGRAILYIPNDEQFIFTKLRWS